MPSLLKAARSFHSLDTAFSACVMPAQTDDVGAAAVAQAGRSLALRDTFCGLLDTLSAVHVHAVDHETHEVVSVCRSLTEFLALAPDERASQGLSCLRRAEETLGSVLFDQDGDSMLLKPPELPRCEPDDVPGLRRQVAYLKQFSWESSRKVQVYEILHSELMGKLDRRNKILDGLRSTLYYEISLLRQALVRVQKAGGAAVDELLEQVKHAPFASFEEGLESFSFVDLDHAKGELEASQQDVKTSGEHWTMVQQMLSDRITQRSADQGLKALAQLQQQVEGVAQQHISDKQKLLHMHEEEMFSLRQEMANMIAEQESSYHESGAVYDEQLEALSRQYKGLVAKNQKLLKDMEDPTGHSPQKQGHSRFSKGWSDLQGLSGTSSKQADLQADLEKEREQIKILKVQNQVLAEELMSVADLERNYSASKAQIAQLQKDLASAKNKLSHAERKTTQTPMRRLPSPGVPRSVSSGDLGEDGGLMSPADSFNSRNPAAAAGDQQGQPQLPLVGRQGPASGSYPNLSASSPHFLPAVKVQLRNADRANRVRELADLESVVGVDALSKRARDLAQELQTEFQARVQEVAQLEERAASTGASSASRLAENLMWLFNGKPLHENEDRPPMQGPPQSLSTNVAKAIEILFSDMSSDQEMHLDLKKHLYEWAALRAKEAPDLLDENVSQAAWKALAREYVMEILADSGSASAPVGPVSPPAARTISSLHILSPTKPAPSPPITTPTMLQRANTSQNLKVSLHSDRRPLTRQRSSTLSEPRNRIVGKGSSGNLRKRVVESHGLMTAPAGSPAHSIRATGPSLYELLVPLDLIGLGFGSKATSTLKPQELPHPAVVAAQVNNALSNPDSNYYFELDGLHLYPLPPLSVFCVPVSPKHLVVRTDPEVQGLDWQHFHLSGNVLVAAVKPISSAFLLQVAGMRLGSSYTLSITIPYYHPAQCPPDAGSFPTKFSTVFMIPPVLPEPISSASTIATVASYFRAAGFADTALRLQLNGVDGKFLMKMTRSEFETVAADPHRSADANKASLSRVWPVVQVVQTEGRRAESKVLSKENSLVARRRVKAASGHGGASQSSDRPQPLVDRLAALFDSVGDDTKPGSPPKGGSHKQSIENASFLGSPALGATAESGSESDAGEFGHNKIPAKIQQVDTVDTGVGSTTATLDFSSPVPGEPAALSPDATKEEVQQWLIDHGFSTLVSHSPSPSMTLQDANQAYNQAAGSEVETTQEGMGRCLSAPNSPRFLVTPPQSPGGFEHRPRSSPGRPHSPNGIMRRTVRSDSTRSNRTVMLPPVSDDMHSLSTPLDDPNHVSVESQSSLSNLMKARSSIKLSDHSSDSPSTELTGQQLLSLTCKELVAMFPESGQKLYAVLHSLPDEAGLSEPVECDWVSSAGAVWACAAEVCKFYCPCTEDASATVPQNEHSTRSAEKAQKSIEIIYDTSQQGRQEPCSNLSSQYWFTAWFSENVKPLAGSAGVVTVTDPVSGSYQDNLSLNNPAVHAQGRSVAVIPCNDYNPGYHVVTLHDGAVATPAASDQVVAERSDTLSTLNLDNVYADVVPQRPFLDNISTPQPVELQQTNVVAAAMPPSIIECGTQCDLYPAVPTALAGGMISHGAQTSLASIAEAATWATETELMARESVGVAKPVGTQQSKAAGAVLDSSITGTPYIGLAAAQKSGDSMLMQPASRQIEQLHAAPGDSPYSESTVHGVSSAHHSGHRAAVGPNHELCHQPLPMSGGKLPSPDPHHSTNAPASSQTNAPASSQIIRQSPPFDHPTDSTPPAAYLQHAAPSIHDAQAAVMHGESAAFIQQHMSSSTSTSVPEVVPHSQTQAPASPEASAGVHAVLSRQTVSSRRPVRKPATASRPFNAYLDGMYFTSDEPSRAFSGPVPPSGAPEMSQVVVTNLHMGSSPASSSVKAPTFAVRRNVPRAAFSVNDAPEHNIGDAIRSLGLDVDVVLPGISQSMANMEDSHVADISAAQNSEPPSMVELLLATQWHYLQLAKYQNAVLSLPGQKGSPGRKLELDLPKQVPMPFATGLMIPAYMTLARERERLRQALASKPAGLPLSQDLAALLSRLDRLSLEAKTWNEARQDWLNIEDDIRALNVWDRLQARFYFLAEKSAFWNSATTSAQEGDVVDVISASRSLFSTDVESISPRILGTQADLAEICPCPPAIAAIVNGRDNARDALVSVGTPGESAVRPDGADFEHLAAPSADPALPATNNLPAMPSMVPGQPSARQVAIHVDSADLSLLDAVVTPAPASAPLCTPVATGHGSHVQAAGHTSSPLNLPHIKEFQVVWTPKDETGPSKQPHQPPLPPHLHQRFPKNRPIVSTVPPGTMRRLLFPSARNVLPTTGSIVPATTPNGVAQSAPAVAGQVRLASKQPPPTSSFVSPVSKICPSVPESSAASNLASVVVVGDLPPVQALPEPPAVRTAVHSSNLPHTFDIPPHTDAVPSRQNRVYAPTTGPAAHPRVPFASSTALPTL